MELFLNEYEKLGVIGRGGFSVVWKVRHHKFHNIRAIKELHEPIEDNDNGSKLYQSFCKESEILLRLGNGGHPNIVKIFRSFIEKDKAYFEMDFVDGEALNKYLENNKFIPVSEAIKFVNDIGSALAYCHEDIYQYCMDKTIDNLSQDPEDAGKVLIDDEKRKELISKYKIWHNDIHSKNVIRKINGDFMLFDFGLAITDGEITSSKRKNGIEEYMSPEKFESGIFNERSDIYSFGILMFEVLAGRVPFEFEEGKNRNAMSEQFKLLEKHKNAPLPEIEPLRKAAFEAANQGKIYKKDYPEWLEKMIKKCLEKKPEDRYFNAKEFFTEFEENLKNNNSKNEEEIEKLKEANEKMHIDLSNLSQDNSDLNEQIKLLAKLIAKLGETTDENIKLKDEIDILKKEITLQNIEISELKEKLADALALNKKNKTEKKYLDYFGSKNKMKGEFEINNVGKTWFGVKLQTNESNPVEPEMMYVEGGNFMMGCTNDEVSDSRNDERPVHNVSLNSFLIGKYQITQTQWIAVMGNNPSNFKGDNLPVENVSWNDVQEFINKLNSATGKQYRLPTEAEWEFAARGGNKSEGYKYSGSNTVSDVAWYNVNILQTNIVGTKQANELGIYDMSGNVWEWCNDRYYKYDDSAQNNPKGPSSESLSSRVIRGGSWINDYRHMRVSIRSNSAPNDSSYCIGFRLASDSQ